MPEFDTHIDMIEQLLFWCFLFLLGLYWHFEEREKAKMEGLEGWRDTLRYIGNKTGTAITLIVGSGMLIDWFIRYF